MSENETKMMFDDQADLDSLFARYRMACPDVNANADFLPKLWQAIDAQRSFWPAFQIFARATFAACACLTLLLLALNLSRPSMTISYSDALMADHGAEKTFYAESVRVPAFDEDQ